SRLRGLFHGCMQGRTMYVIPFCMGPVDAPAARIGVELSDSPYVVANMHTMARVGAAVLERLGTEGQFVPCLHSVGAPLTNGRADVAWPCDPANRHIVHFPETREIWSYGSGYGGNALLGKKCLALRIASVMARDEGWLAEHMFIIKVTNPEGRVRYFAGAFPSACGKTNLAMLTPTLPGWRVETIGDDIAWLGFGADGHLRAINPEAGFFGVAPGTGRTSNPNAMDTLGGNIIYTNVATTADGDVWWEGKSKPVPEGLIDWQGRPWVPGSGGPAAHANARFTAPASQCPVIAPEWDDPHGVPISAILFGGRRAGVVPLVNEARDWAHGVFLGSSVVSEQTAAAEGEIGALRRDPMAMLPFCGYNMADYWSHWLSLAARPGAELPRVFYVNWFRKDAQGRFLWPGFGDNARVLAWIFGRCDGSAEATETPIGCLPPRDALPLEGLDIDPTALDTLLAVDAEGWRAESRSIRDFYRQFGHRVPRRLIEEAEALEARLSRPTSMIKASEPVARPLAVPVEQALR
ncbi:MAG TPA: phosphoenolpyruvate carboxykinase (GTP), partial [Gammaproteobacteria bacterium]|nr:phosphoenolpyruvate carboxykinase (GTP) [Gammaproteobacteria bacterium]